jgi:hypothetical protein
MISAQLLDAGTTAKVNPATYPVTPGMDSIYYNEDDFEEDGVDPRPTAINVLLKDVGEFELKPWPEPFLKNCWIDTTKRYELDGIDGFRLNLHRFDRTTEATPIVPAGEAALELDVEKELGGAPARFTRELTWQEVQARAADPTQWLRLDVINRNQAATDLEDPISAQWAGLRGTEFRLELPNQSLFAPFDLTHPERYRVELDDGTRLPEEEAAHRMTLHAGGRYRLYLRPRKWRFVATVIASYAYISGFEYFVAQETFTRAHTHRPPFFPIRHDLIHTTKTADVPNYFGDLRSVDAGISWQWEHSRSAAAMAHEMIDGQYWTKLVVKIFAGNSDPDVTISSRPPDKGDIVLGIGRIDNYSGRESRSWIVQDKDLTHLYPWEVLGQYLVPGWYVEIN